MDNKQPDGGFDIPVVMIVYKRLDVTQRSFEAVRKVRPKDLYIICDGPRSSEDTPAVNEVRDYIDSHIDWECNVHRDYAEKNLGLRYRMPTGMAWVFEQEDWAIFVEDDIDPTENFFYFCREMLIKYKDNENVMMVSGTNLCPDDPSFGDNDICFSSFASIWGWATWKRAFKHYDVNIRKWPQIKHEGRFKSLMLPHVYRYFACIFDDLQYHWYRTWGYQWTFMLWAEGGLGIVPRYNLINNMGMGDERGEHPDDTSDLIDYVSNLKRQEISLPAKTPDRIECNREYEKTYQLQTFQRKQSLYKRIKYGIRAGYYESLYRTIKEMEQDEAYFDKILPDRYKLRPEECSYNGTDRYRLVSAKEMRKCAWAYRRYKLFGKKSS